MKKVTLKAIANYISENDVQELFEALNEINAELGKDKARKETNLKFYNDAHDVIVNGLGNEPATCAEIYDAIKVDLPQGFTRNKVQYALNNLWQDEIVKVSGSPNMYQRA